MTKFTHGLAVLATSVILPLASGCMDGSNGTNGDSTTSLASSDNDGGGGGTDLDGGGDGGGSDTPTRIWGVTLDSVDNVANIVPALQALPVKPMARIVFDEGVSATSYVSAAAKIHDVAYVMGEILDSQFMDTVSTSQYAARTTEYLSKLSTSVDAWEIGNEINGEWAGDTPTVVAKMNASYDLVKNAGKRTALTLYYNEDCWSSPANEMFKWAENNVSADMKANLDYVWVSYYEHDCNDLKPDWDTVFRRLAAMFPSSKIGFGEVGTDVSSEKAAYLTRYYSLDFPIANYVGGYFWWYGAQDLVPKTKALWSTLSSVIAGF